MTGKNQRNVVALPSAELPPLQVVSTSQIGNQIRGSRNEIWLCPGYTFHGDPVMVYVKLGLSTRAMFTEALCAQVARCIGLQCPTPYIVTVTPRHVGRAGSSPALAFGAEDLSTKSMARPLNAMKVLLDLLDSHKVSDLACVFDEWIANDVRSPSDILVSPEPRIFLIDHESAIGEGLRPEATVTNWLASRLIERTDGKDRQLLLGKLRARVNALRRVHLGDAPLAAQFSPDGVEIYRTLVQFLVDRLEHLDRLLSERVLPDQRYLTEAPPNQASTNAAS